MLVLADRKPAPRQISPSAALLARRALTATLDGDDKGWNTALEELNRSNQRRFDVATAFEIESVAFARAKQRGFARETVAVAANLERLACTMESRGPEAATYRAEAELGLDNAAEAISLLDRAKQAAYGNGDLVQLARISIVRAKAAYLSRDYRRAYRFAGQAYDVLRGRDASAREALVVWARARRASENAFAFPQDATRWAPSACSRVALGIELARHLLSSDRDTAERLAGAAFFAAELHGYEGMAARAAATLGACRVATDEAGGAEWFSVALSRLLRTGDFSLAHDLFAFDRLRAETTIFERLQERLGDALAARLCVIVPQTSGDTRKQRAAVCDLVKAVVNVVSSDAMVDSLDPPIAAVNAANCALAHYAARVCEFAESLELALGALAYFERREVIARRARAATAYVARTLVPGKPRNFMVRP